MKKTKRHLSKADFAASRAIGQKLSKLRKDQGRSAKWVSLELGISAPYLSDLENGRRCFTSEQVSDYMKAIGLTKNDLK